MGCLFCRISRKEIPAKFIHEDEDVFAIHDVNPQAPSHILVIPKNHIATINDVASSQAELLGNIIIIAKNIAHDLNIQKTGYRLVWNTNSGAGQTVFHIHLQRARKSY